MHPYGLPFIQPGLECLDGPDVECYKFTTANGQLVLTPMAFIFAIEGHGEGSAFEAIIWTIPGNDPVRLSYVVHEDVEEVLGIIASVDASRKERAKVRMLRR